ncbi:hypothetical protein AB1L42_23745 [Thalassoglobus sp. JC818]|uniref:hypothetical protein n=1 Tax=Thalassoglobus sp. JC818 TaxID=3232136 RepID=UPI0034580EBC
MPTPFFAWNEDLQANVNSSEVRIVVRIDIPSLLLKSVYGRIDATYMDKENRHAPSNNQKNAYPRQKSGDAMTASKSRHDFTR